MELFCVYPGDFVSRAYIPCENFPSRFREEEEVRLLEIQYKVHILNIVLFFVPELALPMVLVHTWRLFVYRDSSTAACVYPDFALAHWILAEM